MMVYPTIQVDILEIDGAIVPMNEIEELTVLSQGNKYYR